MAINRKRIVSIVGFLCALLSAQLNAEQASYSVSVDERSKSSATFILDLSNKLQVSKIILAPVTKGKGKVLEFGPFDPGHHLVLVNIPKGTYELKSVNVPLYDLPYRYDYKHFANQTFKVKRKKTAYFAQIIVGEKRGKNSLDIRIRNRLVSMLPVFQKHWSGHLSENPLFFAGEYRDHFSESFLEQGE